VVIATNGAVTWRELVQAKCVGDRGTNEEWGKAQKMAT